MSSGEVADGEPADLLGPSEKVATLSSVIRTTVGTNGGKATKKLQRLRGLARMFTTTGLARDVREATEAPGQLPHSATRNSRPDQSNSGPLHAPIAELEMPQPKYKRANLDAAQEKNVANLLHELQMLFVATLGRGAFAVLNVGDSCQGEISSIQIGGSCEQVNMSDECNGRLYGIAM